MRCDHPDIEGFHYGQSDAARLRMFNVSVGLITDDFMEAVKADGPWDLKFQRQCLSYGSGAGAVEQDHAVDL
ncbi:Hypothetical protein FKW44_016295 [Caligus rogercresseyi]|uniref:Uncharacterized protein n=1 Tax=Caligus rogercresseyi TaxID=217165 RepID=A0A7T8H2I4_CALRO|nr:Hypothetical protein FKW44_016295 [Caligus rogercresseyi]